MPDMAGYSHPAFTKYYDGISLPGFHKVHSGFISPNDIAGLSTQRHKIF